MKGSGRGLRVRGEGMLERDKVRGEGMWERDKGEG